MEKINQEYVNRLKSYEREDFDEIIQEELILLDTDAERVAREGLAQIVLEINASDAYLLLADFLLWYDMDGFKTAKIREYGDILNAEKVIKWYLKIHDYKADIDDKQAVMEELKRRLT